MRRSHRHRLSLSWIVIGLSVIRYNTLGNGRSGEYWQWLCWSGCCQPSSRSHRLSPRCSVRMSYRISMNSSNVNCRTIKHMSSIQRAAPSISRHWLWPLSMPRSSSRHANAFVSERKVWRDMSLTAMSKACSIHSGSKISECDTNEQGSASDDGEKEQEGQYQT